MTRVQLISALQRRPLAIAAGLLLALAALWAITSWGDEPDPVGGPQMMRRLTEEQYRAAIADIFSPEIPVNARFEAPVRMDGLAAIGTGEAGMSPYAIEQYEAAAQSVSAAVLSEAHREQFVPCTPATGREFDRACAQQFLDQTGRMLFRRPLTGAELASYTDAAARAYQQVGNFHAGLELSLYAMLVSPHFLFRIEQTTGDGDLAELDAWSKASRLSFFLTNSTPDAELLEAAENGDLDSWFGRRRQVDRLMASPRYEGAVRAFFADMLQLDRMDGLSKDPAIYPAFTIALAADAREQTLRTITEHLLEQDGDYRDLFTTRRALLTRPLGVAYRLPVATRDGWEEGEFAASSGRYGIQSQIAFLASHSHPGRSSPTLRGYALREIFLCQQVPDPPANVNFTAVEDGQAGARPTMRERLEAHRNQPACAGCHKVMDPVGLAMENFDGMGSWRTRENGVRIDSSGSLDGAEFDTPAGLADALRNHREVPRCLAERMYKSAVGRDITWDERPYLDWLITRFSDEDYRVPELMRTIALSDNFFAIRRESGTIARVGKGTGEQS